MNIKLKTLKGYEDRDGKNVPLYEYITVEVDASMFAHLKWEEQFQDLLKCDLTTYINKVSAMVAEGRTDATVMVSALRVIYCCVDSVKLPRFKDFIKLFKPEVMDDLMNSLNNVFEEISKSSTNEKN